MKVTEKNAACGLIYYCGIFQNEQKYIKWFLTYESCERFIKTHKEIKIEGYINYNKSI